MAGTFWKQIPVFNRAPATAPIFVMFDGERSQIPSGHSTIPEHTLYKAKNQNPIMGSADPFVPGVQGFKSLIVIEGEEGWDLPLTKDEWEEHTKRPCREDEHIWFKERYGDDAKAKLLTRGSRNSVAARNRSEAASVPPGLAEFTSR